MKSRQTIKVVRKSAMLEELGLRSTQFMTLGFILEIIFQSV